MNFTIKSFNELTLTELYQILKLRFDVFVIEQNSIYNEFDDIDYKAVHMFAQNKGKVIAYIRIYEKSKNTAVLGRIVIDEKHRGTGLGKIMIQKGIAFVKNEMKLKKINICAQEHLKGFYSDYGFRQVSDAYDDGGIQHIDMVLNLRSES
ncbi:MAG: GNAT family N-acetyltransferase [Nanoarchaeota archaeon]|nr:GNAT family N-acetyltransferase [Nanoarchaeota archaeon]